MENAESITIFIPSMQVVTILLLIYFLALATCTQAISDTISMNQTIRDGETIVSPQQSFELGFFSPTNTSQNRYLGIWYKQFATGTVVWVANRETPIRNNSGELTLHPGGLLILRDSTANRIVWSSNSSTTSRNTVARLLDNSNLMVVDSEENSDDYIWQSFDHPGDTIMPEMKFGRNLRKGAVTNYSSWKSRDDPSQGPFMIYMDFNGLPQIFQKKGDQILYRLGSWNGVAFSGTRNNHPNPIYRNWFYTDENEVSGVFELRNKSVLTRLTLSPEGTMNQWNWFNRTQGWFRYSSLTSDSCERYALCGVHGVCDIGQSPNCGCLRGFTPKRPDQWVIGDWSSGCRRETPLNCGVGEGFRKYSFVKRPDTRGSWFDRNMTLEQCETKCGNECNCTAYTTLDIKQDTGCVLWYNELVDMRVIPDNGQDIYIRMSAAELDKNQRSSRTLLYVLAIIMPVSLGLTIVLVLCVVIIKKMKNKKKKEGELNGELGMGDSIVEDDDLDLPAFNLTTLSVATNYFSSNNKLGEGGFGPVYKGFMEDGQEIAVKRLSIASKQGVEEFKNEVIFISKLQHRNLVNLLGYCVEGTEKLLVYEFMPNNSLDLLLFDETRSKMLDWSRRFHIINGIARGLLYLHQDSQLLIIHRDLKAANILLDQDMNPRISDFGLARSFGGNETERNTTRVAGTYGYMSPEYAGDGKFSVKLDVFSFGVLVLEIVSGKRNRGFFHLAHSHNLLGHAWKQFKEGRTLDLADPSFRTSCDESQVLRSIHVGLLCVQHDSEVRPSMAMVVMMLSDNGKLPEPRQPGFYSDATLKYSGNMLTEESYNLVTESILMPR